MKGSTKTPVHLWIVGGLSALWNAVAAFDYVMTQTRNQGYTAGLTEGQLAYTEQYPVWMDAAWALGVWAGLGGSLLLLARSRYAVIAFGLSLAGLLASAVCQYALSDVAGHTEAGMVATNLFIWAIGLGLFVYALRMRTRGVLR